MRISASTRLCEVRATEASSVGLGSFTELPDTFLGREVAPCSAAELLEAEGIPWARLGEVGMAACPAALRLHLRVAAGAKGAEVPKVMLPAPGLSGEIF